MSQLQKELWHLWELWPKIYESWSLTITWYHFCHEVYNKAKTSWESIVFENYIATLKHECRFLKNYSLNDLNLTEVLQNSKFLPQQNVNSNNIVHIKTAYRDPVEYINPGMLNLGISKVYSMSPLISLKKNWQWL